MEILTRPSVLEDSSIGSILLVSYFGFEIHEIDFGEALGGKIEAFRLPSRGLCPRHAGGAAAATRRKLRVCDQRAGGNHEVLR